MSLQCSDDPRPARARHPDAITLDGGVQVAAVLVLVEEGEESVEERPAALVEHAYLDQPCRGSWTYCR